VLHAAWIRMPLGMEVGLGPGDIVLDGELGTQLPHGKRHSSRPFFGPCLLWPNDWMDQDTTWYGGRPQPGLHCVKWGSNSPPHEKGHSSPHVSAHCSGTVLLVSGHPLSSIA